MAPGEYVTTEPITFRGKAITVLSEAGPGETIIRMGTPADPNRGSVVIFESNETDVSILDGFTITGGRGSWRSDPYGDRWSGSAGGGILCWEASPTIVACRITKNRADHGGGILCLNSDVILSDCIIAENSSENGGGVDAASRSSMTMTDCTIAENSAGDSGGVLAWDNSSVTLTDCIITGNSATGVTPYVNGYGAGLWCGESSLLTLVDCKIAENSAGVGGGLMCWDDSSLEMTNCEIIGNTAQQRGAAVQCDTASTTLENCVIARNSALVVCGGGVFCPYPNSFATLYNCTVWGNSAAQTGGGIYCWQGSATVTNSIVWANIAPSGPEISLRKAGKLSLTYSNVAGGQAGVDVRGGSTLNWHDGNIDADPLFARLGYWDDNGTRDSSDDFWVDDDFHLKSQAGRWDSNSQSWVQDEVTSPCIDAGDPMTRIGWEPFPNGGFVNMGAYAGTPKASETYFGEPICGTVVAGDINGDGQVNRADLEIMALHWTDEEPLPLP